MVICFNRENGERDPKEEKKRERERESEKLNGRFHNNKKSNRASSLSALRLQNSQSVVTLLYAVVNNSKPAQQTKREKREGGTGKNNRFFRATSFLCDSFFSVLQKQEAYSAPICRAGGQRKQGGRASRQR
tara:strand:- start:11 stop:403 length:393 start_codon:yes stop_codon:yes gene_type:complete